MVDIFEYLDELCRLYNLLQMWYKVASPQLPSSDDDDILKELSDVKVGVSMGEEGLPTYLPLTDFQSPKILNDFISSMKVLADLSGMEYTCKVGSRDTIEGVLPYRNFYKSIRFLIAYLEVLFDSYPNAIKLDMSYLSAFKVMQSWPDLLFEKSAKYCTAYPMAYLVQRTELLSGLPPKPNHMSDGLKGAIPFHGKPLRFICCRLRTRMDRRLYSFCWGVLQGVKRATETVSPLFVIETMLKHRTAMKKVPKFDQDDLDTLGSYLDRIPFGPISRNLRILEVSGSASYKTPRRDGGAREEVRTLFKDIDHLVRMNFTGTRTVELRSSYLIPNESTIVRDVYEHTMRKKPAKAGSLISDAIPLAVLNARVAAVLEPLKCRLITAGEAAPYHLSRSYQKDMWSTLKKFDIFSATNRPINVSDFENLLVKEEALGLDFDLWNSGDFSAATDNLNMNHTKEIFEHLLSHTYFGNLDFFDSHTYKQILRSVLYGHIISYPVTREQLHLLQYKSFNSYFIRNVTLEEFDKTHSKLFEQYFKDGSLSAPFREVLDLLKQAEALLVSVHQTNGQLMGSTLSFPVLCIANAICYWRSLERYLKREVPFSKLPVMINGDDILFRTNKVHYPMWVDEISRAGFELSVGKNYVSPSFFSINSKGFTFRNKKIEPVLGFNVGLLMGKSKGNNDRGGSLLAPSYKGIDSLYNEMIMTATNPLRATRRFIHYNLDTIERVTMKGLYNLFLPRVLGGVGFNPPKGLELSFTDLQRGLALKLMRKLNDVKTTPGIKTPVRTISKLDLPVYSGIDGKAHYEWFLSEWVDHPALVQEDDIGVSLSESISYSRPTSDTGKSCQMVSDVLLGTTRRDLKILGLSDRMMKEKSGNSMFPSLSERNRYGRQRWVHLARPIAEGYRMLEEYHDHKRDKKPLVPSQLEPTSSLRFHFNSFKELLIDDFHQNVDPSDGAMLTMDQILEYELGLLAANLPWGETRKDAQNCFRFSHQRPVDREFL